MSTRFVPSPSSVSNRTRLPSFGAVSIGCQFIYALSSSHRSFAVAVLLLRRRRAANRLVVRYPAVPFPQCIRLCVSVHADEVPSNTALITTDIPGLRTIRLRPWLTWCDDWLAFAVWAGRNAFGHVRCVLFSPPDLAPVDVGSHPAPRSTDPHDDRQRCPEQEKNNHRFFDHRPALPHVRRRGVSLAQSLAVASSSTEPQPLSH